VRKLFILFAALFAAAHAGETPSMLEGFYLVTSPSYVETRHIDIEYRPEGFFSIKAHFGDSELFWNARGLEAYGYLGAMGTEDMPVIAIYEIKDSGLAGLSTGYEYTDVISENSAGAEPLTLSGIDFTGSYKVIGNIGDRKDSTESYEIIRDMDIPEITPFEYTMIIKPSGKLWYVDYTSQASDWGSGIGIAVGDELVAGFIDESQDTEIWMLKRRDDGSGLEGRWLYCFKDRYEKDVVMNGWMEAKKDEP
jgi:hypothetical protein